MRVRDPVPTSPSPPARDGWEEVVLPVKGGRAGRRRLRDWVLVLEAMEIPHRRRRQGYRVALFVPAADRSRAEAELRAYESENLHWPPKSAEPPTVQNAGYTVAVLLALGLFHDLTFQPPGRVFGIAVEWHRLGAMDASRVLDGEWWRLVTALTLHADGLHLMGNLILGGLLLIQLNRQLRVGLGFALVLGAGILGNLTNALVREPSHVSIGGSTAVFGALGILVALAASRMGRADWRRWVVPLGAGAGMIALTGVGGERTDYLAHLFGFGWGLVAGLLTRWPKPLRNVPGQAVSTAAGLSALALVIGAWWLAIGLG